MCVEQQKNVVVKPLLMYLLLNCDVCSSTGAAAATRAAQVHGGGNLRANQGRVQLPTSTVPHVSSPVRYESDIARNS